MSNPLFTPELLNGLRTEVGKRGHRPISVIAADLGITKNTLIGKLRREGIEIAPTYAPPTFVSRMPIEDVKAAVTSSTTWTEAASKLKVRAGTLSIFCRGRDIRLAVGAPKPACPRYAFNSYRGTLATRPRRAPASTIAEMRRLADAAIAAGRITRLAPGFAANSKNMVWERIL